MKKLLWVLLVLVVMLGSIIYYLFFSMSRLPSGKFLERTTSPNGAYAIDFYLANSGATTGYSIRGELVHNMENIYWEYLATEVRASWLDDHTVVINGHQLDVRTDHYDWRKE